MSVRDFYNIHKGETCLIVGVGPNLKLTPPEWFDYPSLSCNSIFKYQGWQPTYYVGVDERLKLEEGENIKAAFPDIPKFIPSPDWDDLQGENFYRFKHRQGSSLLIGGQSPRDANYLLGVGLTYRRVMDAVIQIAWYMGFSTMLMIGVQHKPDDPRAHFWGEDKGVIVDQPLKHWFDGYAEMARNVNLINISEDTYVPDDIIPRDDWRNWYTAETVT